MTPRKIISKMMMGDIIYKVETQKDFDTAHRSLLKSIENNGFHVTHIHNIKEAFHKAELKYEDGFEYQLVQFCNAKKAQKSLSMSTDVGVMMPKTIIIFTKDKKTYFQFMKMKPFMVSLMFPDINLAPMSKNVMATMTKIVNEAAI